MYLIIFKKNKIISKYLVKKLNTYVLIKLEETWNFGFAGRPSYITAMGKRPMTVKQRARAMTSLKKLKMQEKCDGREEEGSSASDDEVVKKIDEMTLPAYVRNEMSYEHWRYKRNVPKDAHSRSYISNELLYERRRREKMTKSDNEEQHPSDDHMLQYDETDIVPHLLHDSYGINIPISHTISGEDEPIPVSRSGLVYSSNLQNTCDDISTISDPKTTKQIFGPASNQTYFGITVTSAINIACVLSEEERHTTVVLTVEKSRYLDYTMKPLGHTNGIFEVDFSVGKNVPVLCHIAVSDEVGLDDRIRILFSGIVDAGFVNIIIDPNVSDGNMNGEITRILAGHLGARYYRVENIVLCGLSTDRRDTFLRTHGQILTGRELQEQEIAHGHVPSKIPRCVRPEGWVRPLDRRFPKRFISPVSTIPKKLSGTVFFFHILAVCFCTFFYCRYVYHGHSAESIRQDILHKCNQ